jgi:hypothetical protein
VETGAHAQSAIVDLIAVADFLEHRDGSDGSALSALFHRGDDPESRSLQTRLAMLRSSLDGLCQAPRSAISASLAHSTSAMISLIAGEASCNQRVLFASEWVEFSACVANRDGESLILLSRTADSESLPAVFALRSAGGVLDLRWHKPGQLAVLEGARLRIADCCFLPFVAMQGEGSLAQTCVARGAIGSLGELECRSLELSFAPVPPLAIGVNRGLACVLGVEHSVTIDLERDEED